MNKGIIAPVTLTISAVGLGIKLVTLNAQQYDKLLTLGFLVLVVVSSWLWFSIESDRKKHKAEKASLTEQAHDLRTALDEIYADCVLYELKRLIKGKGFFSSAELAKSAGLPLENVKRALRLLQGAYEIVEGMGPDLWQFDPAKAAPCTARFCTSTSEQKARQGQG